MAQVLFCLFTLLCLWLLLTNVNVVSSFNILTGTFFVYYFFGLGGYMNGDYSLRYTDGEVVLRFNQSQLIRELVLINLFAAGLLLATFVSGKRIRAGEYTPPAAPPYRSMLASAYLLMCAGIIMYWLFIHHVYGSISHMLHMDRYSLYRKKKGMGSLLIGLYIFYAGALIRLFYYLFYKNVKQPFPFIPLAVVLILFYVQYKNGDRSNIIYFLLPLCLAFLYKKPKITPYFLLAVPVAIMLLQFAGVQRKLRIMNSHEGAMHFIMHHRQAMSIFQNGEFMAPTLVDRMVCQNMNMVTVRYGGTYIDALLSMPPSWMTPRRPMLPAEWYASTFFPEEYSSGQGYGFSVVSESILNFYYAGPLIYGFLLGLLLLYADKRVKNASFYPIVLFCILQYYVFLVPRSGIAALCKPALIITVVTAGCSLVVSSLYKKQPVS